MLARTFKIAFTATACVLGVLLIGLAIFLYLKSKKMSRNESLGISETDNLLKGSALESNGNANHNNLYPI